MRTNAFKKIVVLVLALALLSPIAPIAVPRAHAIDTEEMISVPQAIAVALKHAALIAARTAIQSMTRSMVNWINSGFNGSPAFETNLGVNLGRLSDGVAFDFLNQLQANTSINSPYLSQIVGNVRTGYLLYSSRDAIAARLQYTLNQYSNNSQAFLRGSFTQGGLNAWFATTRTCGNDPYCAEFAVQDELANRVSASVQQRLNELNWGQGFLSWRGNNCSATDATSDNGADPGHQVVLSDADHTQQCDIRSPGTLLAGQMTFLTNQPALQLTVADSIDQILSALASQLMSQVFGGIGLLGANTSGGGGGGNTNGNSNSGNSGTTLASSLANAFIQQVQNDRSTVATYRTQWQKIQGAAQAAVNACDFGGNSEQKADADAVLARANANIAGANTLTTALDAIIARAQAVQTAGAAGTSAQVTVITDDYDALASTSLLAHPADIAEAAIESQSTGTAGGATIYSRMRDIAQGLCH